MLLPSRLGNITFIWDSQGPAKHGGIYVTEEGENDYNFMAAMYQSQPQVVTTKLPNRSKTNILCNVLGIMNFPMS